MSNDTPLSEIPMPFRERYAELIDIINEFCAAHLNDEYRAVSQRLVSSAERPLFVLPLRLAV